MIKKWIFGKYIKEIEEHKFLINSQKIEIERLGCNSVEWSKMAFDLKEIIKKIEGSYRPENMSNYDEVKYKIGRARNNATCFEYVVAISNDRIVKSIHDHISTRKKTIKMDIRLGCSAVVSPCDDENKMTHELAVNLARGCGDAVMDELLKQKGWRRKDE